MVITEKRMKRHAFGLFAAATVFLGLGAFAVAAPFAFTTVYIPSINPPAMKLASLANGPAIQLAKAGDGFDEDCVRVIRVVGPGHSNVAATRGFVCDGRH